MAVVYVYGCPHKGKAKPTMAVEKLLKTEYEFGLETLQAYVGFQQRAERRLKYELLDYLIKMKSQGKCILGYGAAAKGNTFLNYAGIKTDLLKAVADRALSKQGKYLPGSHIPVVSPEKINSEEVDALLVLPWNLVGEVAQQIPNIDLVTAIPGIRHWDKAKS